jgi:hypothetical protein
VRRRGWKEGLYGHVLRWGGKRCHVYRNSVNLSTVRGDLGCTIEDLTHSSKPWHAHQEEEASSARSEKNDL